MTKVKLYKDMIIRNIELLCGDSRIYLFCMINVNLYTTDKDM